MYILQVYWSMFLSILSYLEKYFERIVSKYKEFIGLMRLEIIFPWNI